MGVSFDKMHRGPVVPASEAGNAPSKGPAGAAGGNAGADAPLLVALAPAPIGREPGTGEPLKAAESDPRGGERETARAAGGAGGDAVVRPSSASNPTSIYGGGDEDSAAELLDEYHVGDRVVLPMVWRHRRVVVVFLRHLGCHDCARMAAGVAQLAEKLRASNTALVAVSLGRLEEAAAWSERLPKGWPGMLLLDDSTGRDGSKAAATAAVAAVYRAFGLTRVLPTHFAEAETIAASETALAAGFKPWHGLGGEAEWPGDPLQLGGVFVLGPGDTCDFAHRSSRFADHPDLREVLVAATGLTSDGSEVVYPSSERWADDLQVRTLAPADGSGDDAADKPPVRSRRSSSFFLKTEASPSAGEEEAKASGPPTGAPASDHTPSPPSVSSVDKLILAVEIIAGVLLVVSFLVTTRQFREAQRGLIRWFGTLGARVLLSVVLGGVIGYGSLWFAGVTSRERKNAPSTRQQKRAASPAAGKETSDTSACQLRYVLHTPDEVDDVVQGSIGVQCDCSPIVGAIPVEGKLRTTSVSSEPGNVPLPVLPEGHPPVSEEHRAAVDQSLRERADAVLAKDPDLASSLRAYQETICYLREFLAKPHGLVGRRGPVCPFVPVSLKKSTVYISAVRTAHVEGGPETVKSEIAKMVKSFLPEFKRLEPNSGRLVANKAVVFVFPDVANNVACRVIDEVQLECKPFFVAEGLMIGEFHRRNNACGLRNPDFYPLRTPFPSLALRHMVPSDLAFLSPDKYAPKLRVKFLSSFLSNFSGVEPYETRNKKELDGARDELERARQELRLAASTGADKQRRASTAERGGAAESSPPEGALDDPLARLRQADSSEEFRRNAHEMVEWIIKYRKTCSELPVRSTVAPGYLRRLLPAEAPQGGEPWKDIMNDLDRAILPGLTHWESKRFFAYFKPHAAYSSVLGEMLCAGLNVMGFSWIGSPACTELEVLALNWLGKALNLPDMFLTSDTGSGGGVIQGSAGESAIVVLLAARTRVLAAADARAAAEASAAEGSEATDERHVRLLSSMVVYVSDQTHSIAQKACMVVGIPTSRLRVLPTTREDAYALSPAVLRDAIAKDVAAGLVPLMVVATPGTTSSTALDQIGELADAAKDGAAGCPYTPWVHVDAAYGGAYAICPEFAHILDGVDKADSIAVNAHKKLLTNFDCCALWVRDREPLLAALSLTPEYLRNRASESGLVVDLKDWQLPLGRRFRALKLWFVLRSLGVEGLQAHVRNGVRLARAFAEHIEGHPLFELYTPRTMGLVCFRIAPHAEDGAAEDVEATNAVNQELLDRLNARGRVFIIHTKLSERLVLRLAVGGMEHDDADVDAAWQEIRAQAEEVSRAHESRRRRSSVGAPN